MEGPSENLYFQSKDEAVIKSLPDILLMAL